MARVYENVYVAVPRCHAIRDLLLRPIVYRILLKPSTKPGTNNRVAQAHYCHKLTKQQTVVLTKKHARRQGHITLKTCTKPCLDVKAIPPKMDCP